jgi:hypothetical protein
MTKRYSVKAVIPGVGPIHHLLKAESSDQAFERLQRAYPNREIITFRAQRRGVETQQETKR